MNLVRKLREVKHYITRQLLYYKGNYDKKTWYFVLPYGIGDAYIVSSLISKFQDKNGKAVLIFIKKNQAFIPTLFDSNIEVRVDEKFPGYAYSDYYPQFIPGKPLLLHPNNLYDRALVRTVGFNKMTLVDTYKLLLNIHQQENPVNPRFTFSQSDEEQVAKLFAKNQLVPGKTVLLCPQAITIIIDDKSFWTTLAKKIEELNLVPVFMNSAPDEGYKTVSFGLELAKLFCDQAGYMISTRSGFCDLVASSTAKKIVLYLDMEFFAGRLIDSCGLVNMKIAEPDSTFEYVLSDNKDKDIQTIIRFIHE